MEVECLIELKCAIVVLPVLGEEIEEPLSGQLGGAVVLLSLTGGVFTLGEGHGGDRLRVVHALTRGASFS